MQKEHPERPSPQYPIESVDRALRLLLMFSDRSEVRLSDAREALGVGQSTAHRLMAMLVFHGFVQQDPVTRVYRAGPALMEIGLSVVNRMDLRVVARPILESLSAATGETVHLGVLEEGQVRFLDGVESDLALRVSGRVGRVLPAHATSLGKAMLAQLPLDAVHALYPREALPPVTARTMTRRSELTEELERVRARGYAVNVEESEEGVTSVGKAVVRPGGEVVGALSVAAPLSRTDDDKRERRAALLAEACEKLAAALGWAATG
ncbi:IclR family transcriptional regulator [Streptomyces sp. NPDC005813]|uniref:IclR family transcriptional regulator n=1 Tax=Streptomyces sp. NPDC005813 TaxID=3155592 RepID=UPI0034094941